MVTTPVKFSSTHVCVTASVNARFDECTAFRLWMMDCLNRHFSGDYGEISEADKKLNNDAVKDHSQVMSVYLNGSETIWIITDAGNEVTTVLFPSEY